MRSWICDEEDDDDDDDDGDDDDDDADADDDDDDDDDDDNAAVFDVVVCVCALGCVLYSLWIVLCTVSPLHHRTAAYSRNELVLS